MKSIQIPNIFFDLARSGNDFYEEEKKSEVLLKEKIRNTKNRKLNPIFKIPRYTFLT